MIMRWMQVLVCCGILCGAARGQGAVHVVDPAGGPGSDFTTIFAAHAAASPGDVLLLRGGTYDEFLSITKGVTLLADGAPVGITSITVSNVPAGPPVRIRGVTVLEGPGVSPGVASAFNCDAAVWFEDCVFLSAPVPFQSGGVRAFNCRAFVLVRCEIPPPDDSLVQIGPSLGVTDSDVWVFDSEIVGMSGFSSLFGAAAGSAAVQVDGGTLVASGSIFRGGKGGNGQPAPNCTTGSNGGAGLIVTGEASVLRVDATIVGGAGGLATGDPGCAPGVDGPDVVTNSGSVTGVPGLPARGTLAEAPVREGDLLTVSLTDLAVEPGDYAWIMWSLDATSGQTGSLGSLFGSVGVLSAPTLIVLGPLPASPTFDLSVVVPELGPGFESVELFVQGLVLDVSASKIAPTAPSMLTLLDASF